jgi:hypothetical protein
MLFVRVDNGSDTGSDAGYDELFEELRDRVRSLENQLADERGEQGEPPHHRRVSPAHPRPGIPAVAARSTRDGLEGRGYVTLG